MEPDECESFGFLSAWQNCETESSKKIFVDIPAGYVSPFGDIVGPSGLRCLFCEEREPAKCEDFGENEHQQCPGGFIVSKKIHNVGEISSNGKYCFTKTICYACNPPFVHRSKIFTSVTPTPTIPY